MFANLKKNKQKQTQATVQAPTQNVQQVQNNVAQPQNLPPQPQALATQQQSVATPAPATAEQVLQAQANQESINKEGKVQRPVFHYHYTIINGVGKK